MQPMDPYTANGPDTTNRPLCSQSTLMQPMDCDATFIASTMLNLLNQVPLVPPGSMHCIRFITLQLRNSEPVTINDLRSSAG